MLQHSFEIYSRQAELSVHDNVLLMHQLDTSTVRVTYVICFCRDAVMLQHSFEIYSRRVELSVHDNVLLVHQLDTSTVLLLDVRARSNGPIANPLPLAIATNDQVCSTMLSISLPVTLSACLFFS